MGSKLRKIFNAIRGAAVVRKFHKHYKGSVLIVNTLPAIGDSCVFLAYLPEFLKTHEKTKLIIEDSDRSYSLTKKFGINPSFILSVKKRKLAQIDALCCFGPFQFIVRRWMREGWFIVGHPWFYIDPNVCNIPNFTFLQLFKYSIFKLAEESQICYPKIPPIETTRTLKTPYIILNPYSNSSFVDASFFEAVAQRLVEIGFTVYTNCPPGLPPIENTFGLNVSIDELYFLSENATAIISVRSGILDYIISNSKRIVALYDAKTNFTFCYSLRAWQTECEIFEHVYSNSLDVAKIVLEATTNGD